MTGLRARLAERNLPKWDGSLFMVAPDTPVDDLIARGRQWDEETGGRKTTIDCERCGATVQRVHALQKYCSGCQDGAKSESDRLWHQANRDAIRSMFALPDIECLVCGVTFTPRHTNIKCCGPACSLRNRKLAKNRRRRESRRGE